MKYPCSTNIEIEEKVMSLYKNLNITIQQIIIHINLLKLKNDKEMNENIVCTSIENNENEFSKCNMQNRKCSYTHQKEYGSCIETILNDLKDSDYENEAKHFLKRFPNSKLTNSQIIKRIKYIKCRKKVDVENIAKFNNMKTSSIAQDVIQNHIQTKIIEKTNPQSISMTSKENDLSVNKTNDSKKNHSNIETFKILK